MSQTVVEKMDRVFNPKTVAVVGDKKAQNYMWLRSLLTFEGKLYSVQIDPGEFPGIAELGVKNYLSLLDIPDQIDFVVASVPRAVAPSVVKDCIRKKVGGLAFYTSGFAETETEEGIRLEQTIGEMARSSGLNIIGPNCMSIYNPVIGLRQTSLQAYGEAGSVGFISQSGTHATNFSMMGAQAGIKISKSVSYGNAVVLDSTDYLEYLGQDEDTKIIGMYIEGVKDGRAFFRCLREVAKNKPVLIWKGGQTPAGARAAVSHTGALAHSSVVWQTLVRQCGAIEVNNLEEMIDTVSALLYIKPASGNRVGLLAMSGGQSVVISDVFAKEGLEVPLLTGESYKTLASFFITIGGSYRNPLDMSSSILSADNPISNLKNMLDVLDRDRNIDCVVLELSMLLGPMRKNPKALDVICDFRRRAAKPFFVILTRAHREDPVAGIRKKLLESDITSFPDFERGARALRKVVDYYRSR